MTPLLLLFKGQSKTVTAQNGTTFDDMLIREQSSIQKWSTYHFDGIM